MTVIFEQAENEDNTKCTILNINQFIINPKKIKACMRSKIVIATKIKKVYILTIWGQFTNNFSCNDVSKNIF